MTAAEKVTVKFFGGLSKVSVQGGVTEVPADVGTVRDLITSLQFKEYEVGTVLINGTPVLPDTVIKAGDEVALFKPLG
jgi:molybdopterin converting factor small subunit